MYPKSIMDLIVSNTVIRLEVCGDMW